MIPITLITGFLGSGKTTLLKQIIEKNRNRKFIYLVNEFSPTDVDGALISNETADTVTIPGGSIFCKCLVTQFVSQLSKIPERFSSENHNIERVIIEASGIADPKVIRKMLEETHLSDTYRLQSLISVIDPLSFLKLLHTLPNIRSQIEAADLVIINKTDLVAKSQTDQTKIAVCEINSNAEIIKTNYCRMETDIFSQVSSSSSKSGEYAPCRDPHYSVLLFRNKSVTIDQLKAAILPISDDIYRLKGFIVANKDIYYIDYSVSGWEVTLAPQSVQETSVSVIVNGEHRRKVVEHFQNLNLF
jgi:G3E family GTPase